jgi:glucose/arabinose dehydrogenase
MLVWMLGLASLGIGGCGTFSRRAVVADDGASTTRCGGGSDDVACAAGRRATAGRDPCIDVPAARGARVAAALVSDRLESPTYLTAPRSDTHRLFVTEQHGRIRVIEDGVLLEEPFLDIRERVGCCGERGLLSLAFDPDYRDNGRFFVDYTNREGDTVVSRFETGLDRSRADESSEVVLLTIHQPHRNHNGGQLAFDAAGLLYVGMGDGGGGGDPQEAAQDDTQLLGKLLRVNVDVDSPPYWATPPDNPHAHAPGPLSLIWAKGLRNPWRFCFDRANDDLYIADVGQDQIEEIDYAPAPRRGGENYGWDVFEGTHCFEPDPEPTCPDPPTGFTQPVHEYTHLDGCSISGGYVYRGCAMPDLRGTYFFADYCTNRIWSLQMAGGHAIDLQERTVELPVGSSISSFGEDARGELYIVNLTGSVYRIVPGS